MKEVSFGFNIGGTLTKCIIIDSTGKCCVLGNISTTENKVFTFKFV